MDVTFACTCFYYSRSFIPTDRILIITTLQPIMRILKRRM